MRLDMCQYGMTSHWSSKQGQLGPVLKPTGMLTKLTKLDLFHTQVTDAGCAALASALDRGALPVLENLFLEGIPASAAARVAVRRAVRAREPGN